MIFVTNEVRLALTRKQGCYRARAVNEQGQAKLHISREGGECAAVGYGNTAEEAVQQLIRAVTGKEDFVYEGKIAPWLVD